MTRPIGRTNFAEPYKQDALALMVLESSSERVVTRLKELYPEEQPPSRQTLGIWFRDPQLEPDEFLIRRMETLRRGQFMARFHGLGAEMADRLLAELPTMAWRDVKDAMIALGITSDKVVGTQRSGGSAMSVTINDNRGPRVYTVIAPEDENDKATVIEGAAPELLEDGEDEV